MKRTKNDRNRAKRRHRHERRMKQRSYKKDARRSGHNHTEEE